MTDPKDINPADTRRFKLIPPENLTPDQRALVAAIRGGARSQVKGSGATRPGPLGGSFNVWLRSPSVGDRVQALGEELRFRSSLPSKLNEMAILIASRLWTCQYEWHAHCKLALAAGLSPTVARDIAEHRRPASMDTDEAIVYDFSFELHKTKAVSDATFNAALGRFGERGVVDLITVNGYYTMVAMAMNVDRTPVPDGAPPPLR